MRVKDPRRLCLGLLFIAFAVPAYLVAGRYVIGTATNMGPGYFPRLVSGSLFVLGVVVAVQSLFSDGNGFDWRAAIRPIACISGAVLAFGLTLQRLGVVVAVMLLVIVASMASSEARWKEVAAISLLLGVLTAAVFVGGLGMQAPIWPWS